MDIEVVGTSIADSTELRPDRGRLESAIEVPTPSISIWISRLRLAIPIFTIAECKACGSLAYNFGVGFLWMFYLDAWSPALLYKATYEF